MSCRRPPEEEVAVADKQFQNLFKLPIDRPTPQTLPLEAKRPREEIEGEEETNLNPMEKKLADFQKTFGGGEDGVTYEDFLGLEELEKRFEMDKQMWVEQGLCRERWELLTGNLFRARETVRKRRKGRIQQFDEFDNWLATEEARLPLAKAELVELEAQVKRMNKNWQKKVSGELPLEICDQVILEVQARLAVVQGYVEQLKEKARQEKEVKEAEAAASRARREAAKALKAAEKQKEMAEKQAAKEAKQAEADAEKAGKEAAKAEKRAEKEAADAEKAEVREAKAAERATAKAEAERAKQEKAEEREAAKKAREEAEAAKAAAKAEAKAAKAAAKAAAKQAALEAREEKKRLLKEELERNFEELKQTTEDAAGREAVKYLMRTRQQSELQAEFDSLEEDMWPAFPDQPSPPRELRVAKTPVASIALDTAQHLSLFLNSVDAFAGGAAEEASTDTASSTDTSEAPPDDPMPLGAVMKTGKDDELLEDPLIFNTHFARHLLKEHLTSLKEMHEEAMKCSTKAQYTRPDSALGNVEESIEQLLPTLKHMAAYRGVILAAKQILISNELKKAPNSAKLAKALAVVKGLNANRQQWRFEAQKMLLLSEGKLPGQLTAPQPLFLPLRVYAPPRVGKSASALLVASLAKRLGIKVCYSVSPNKTVPLAELRGKLEKLGWTASTSSCQTMPYFFKEVDELQGTNQSLCAVKADAVDMVGYSSDVLSDCAKMGAILASWKLTSTVVLQIRDEAQSLAKELDNEEAPCHRKDVPAPPILNQLRHFYGNEFGLNCLVSATQLPTLLEEDLYGFYGSTQQNIRAALPIAATATTIKSQLGSYFLPILPASLLPKVPDGYVGVEALQTFSENGREMTLSEGAGLSALSVNEKVLSTEAPKEEEEKLKPTRRSKRSSVRESQAEIEKKEKEQIALKEDAVIGGKETVQDLLALKAHFAAFLNADQLEISKGRFVVPMHLAALNNQIRDSGMVSFVRWYGKIAHNRALDAGVFKKRTAPEKPNVDYGVCFMLFTSTLGAKDFKDRDDLKVQGDVTPLKGGGASVVVFVYSPEWNETTAKDEEPVFKVHFASNAQQTIDEIYKEYKITRFSTLGFSLLAAGLTLQHVIEREEDELIFCPTFPAVAEAGSSSLDGLLQMVGRSFVDIKNVEKPPDFKINLLSTEGAVERLGKYSNVERILSTEPGQKMYEILKSAIDKKNFVETGLGELGRVGVRRGRIADLLGIVPPPPPKQERVVVGEDSDDE